MNKIAVHAYPRGKVASSIPPLRVRVAGITSNHAVFQILENRFSFPHLIDTLFSNLDENKVFFCKCVFTVVYLMLAH